MPADSDSGSSQREHQRSDPMAEHKRRARWRLLGALIITGAVAAVAPVFLEDEARPLSQDLLIDIPSKNSAFTKIETLKPAAPVQSPATTDSAAIPPVTPSATPPAVVLPKVSDTTTAKSDKKSSPAESAPDARSAPKSDPKSDPKAVKSEPKADPKADAKTVGKAVQSPAPTKAAATSGFLVQVGAYSKLESATAVRTKLVAGGHRVAIETIKADDGTDRHRVRIGPFDTREQALAVRDRARGQGYDAVVVTP